MEEKFVLLNVKLTDIYNYTVALTAALYALADKSDELPEKHFDTVKLLRDKLLDAGIMSI